MSRRPLRVLLVEDNPDDATLVLREIQRGDYDVNYDCVETAEAMRAALASERWDIVICDYRLPGFSAPAALAVLKDLGQTIPFIIVSGTVGEETAVEALKAGADDFLVKGRLARLLPAIARSLEDAAVRAERLRLQEALQQSQKVEALGQLAGGIAHDFNNLLTAILGFAELLRDEMGPDSPGAADVREIHGAAERAAALTRQLLAFSRKQPIKVAPVALNDVINNLQPMLRRLLGEPVKIDVRLEPGLHPVLADATQMEQLIVNLAVNARDAMPTGGTLTIETRNLVREAEFRTMDLGKNAAAYSMLRVTDTGIGMPSRIMARVFEPFFTTKERGKGTGLGLSVVHGIVAQLGGAIYLDSEPGRGTTFRIYLAKADRAVQATQAMPESKATEVGSETILLVEDEASVRHFVRAALTRHGYVVLEAPSAEDALAVVADPTCAVDLVLSDVGLPGLSGRELVARIAVQHPGVRTLLMSGCVEQPDAMPVGDGVAALLDKPFTMQALLTRVREVLKQPSLVRAR